MTIEELQITLLKLRDSSYYSDDHISQDQYNYYSSFLTEANAMGAEAARNAIIQTVFELDINRPTIARRIAYPFQYQTHVLDWRNNQIKKDDQGNQVYFCSACGCNHNMQHTDSSLDLTIDHCPPLSKLFNEGDWKNDREIRKVTYNTTGKMRLMCRAENSSIGGERYDPDLIEKVFYREL